jgi:hypothetical protein
VLRKLAKLSKRKLHDLKLVPQRKKRSFVRKLSGRLSESFNELKKLKRLLNVKQL